MISPCATLHAAARGAGSAGGLVPDSLPGGGWADGEVQNWPPGSVWFAVLGCRCWSDVGGTHADADAWGWDGDGGRRATANELPGWGAAAVAIGRLRGGGRGPRASAGARSQNRAGEEASDQMLHDFIL